MMIKPVKNPTKFEALAVKATRWIGTTSSLVVHTLLFGIAFVLALFGVSMEEILLVLTTIVSLEAIYLAIFIQMSVNRSMESLQGVEEDIEEIQEDIDEIQENVDEIQEDVDEIQEDVDEIQEDSEEEEQGDKVVRETLAHINGELQKIISEVEFLNKRNNTT